MPWNWEHCGDRMGTSGNKSACLPHTRHQPETAFDDETFIFFKVPKRMKKMSLFRMRKYFLINLRGQPVVTAAPENLERFLKLVLFLYFYQLVGCQFDQSESILKKTDEGLYHRLRTIFHNSYLKKSVAGIWAYINLDEEPVGWPRWSEIVGSPTAW